MLLKSLGGKRSTDFPADDQELHDLGTLVTCLRELEIEPPESFGDDLRRQLPLMAEADASRLRPRFWGGLIAWLGAGHDRIAALKPLHFERWPRAVSSAVALILVAALLVLLRSLVDPPVASASEILSRSDAALGALVHPGQLLYRRWKLTSRSTSSDSTAGLNNAIRFIDEWMDGGDVDRVAGRWYAADGRLLVAYSSVGDENERRSHAYFSPGVYGEARGVLNIEPTRDEFFEAAARFPERIQRALKVYLDRQYIYLPIIGERRTNRVIVESPNLGVSELPRVVSSVEPSVSEQGQSIFRVRVVDPTFIDFNWRSEGPPRVRLAWVETVNYIARDSYLGLKIEKTVKFEDGRQRSTTKELVEMRTVSIAGSTMDPFKLTVPEGTPIQRQSAFEQLTGVANAFSRLPEFTARIAHQHTEN